jgi:hypothetical protein
LSTCTAIGLAFYIENTAAMFIAVTGSALYWQGHANEVKLNKLLDAQGIVVTPSDMDDH